MTKEQWVDLRARTQAWIDTDMKEYKSGLSLLIEWTSSRSFIEQFQYGSPGRYISSLTNVLRKLKEMTNYPKLINTVELQKRPYLAEIPVNVVPDTPEAKARPVILPPPVPEKWNRYASFDSYKDKLPKQLRQQGEEWLATWFNKRRHLHDLAKNQEAQGVNKTVIAKTLEDLSKQNDEIERFYDAVEAALSGKEEESSSNECNIPTGRFTKAQIDDMLDPEFKAACKLKRIEANTKYITRNDINTKNPEERELRIRELREWGIDVEEIMKKRS